MQNCSITAESDKEVGLGVVGVYKVAGGRCQGSLLGFLKCGGHRSAWVCTLRVGEGRRRRGRWESIYREGEFMVSGVSDCGLQNYVGLGVRVLYISFITGIIRPSLLLWTSRLLCDGGVYVPTWRVLPVLCEQRGRSAFLRVRCCVVLWAM